LTLSAPVLSAPIAGFTDLVFRGILRDLGGCGLIYTEMVNAGGWIDGSMPPGRLRGVDAEARPLGVQLWDRDPAMIEEAARRLVELEVSVIDLNFGCPKKRIMGKHAAGATLLRDPATVGKLVAAAVRGAGRVPVTAKIRLGASLEQPTAQEVARSAEANGAAAITVHGRTADQHYGVPCHLEQDSRGCLRRFDPGDRQRRRARRGFGFAHDAGDRGVRRDGGARSTGASVGLPRDRRRFARRKAAVGTDSRGTARTTAASPCSDGRPRGDRWGTVLMRKFAVRYLAGVPGARLFASASRAPRAVRSFAPKLSMALAEEDVQVRAGTRFGGKLPLSGAAA
jgi:hypothetical protein